MSQEQKWIGRTYGNQTMHKWLIFLLKFVNVRLLYIFSSVFVIPICLIVNKSIRIIYKYFRERLRYNVFKSFWKTYINHCLFGQSVIDKFAMYAGKKFKIEIEGYEYFDFLAKQKEGFIQLSSHIGNYEIAGYSLVAKDKPFNALLFFGEKESVMTNRNKMFASTNIKMIPVRSDIGHLFEINAALLNGEIVSIPADRIWGSNKNIYIDFLGAKAKFPIGPFYIATMKEVNVLTVHVMKIATTKYKIYITPLQYDKTISRKEQINELADKYIKELERILKLYPTQWYNFFKFWE